MKKQPKTEGNLTTANRKNELKTDPPLSEKDEVKEAERRTNAATKKRA